jgi:uncharacterized protein (UPF0335 family)
MARGFYDDESLSFLRGQELSGEPFDPIEKSIEFIERAKVVQTEIAMLQDDLKDIWNEARDYGLDVTVLKKVLTRMKKSQAELEAEDIAVGNIELRLDGRDLDGETYERREDDYSDRVEDDDPFDIR